MKVTVSEVRRVTELLCRHLEETGRDEIDVSEDYYWMIPKEEVYDPERDPNELDLGQLSDDWNELQGILSGENPSIGYGFVWLSSILRVVGEKTVH